ncbi:hypothetical protein V8G54_032388 [Vigna mungo]|uniref:Ubiquitin carboxyl-terminal hydrolase 12 n=1 Tax=Vigna mungo TaxID=3915 RepID=A0AAQ3MLZ1_VIGMU
MRNFAICNAFWGFHFRALPLRLGVRCGLLWIRTWVTWLVLVFVFVQQQEDKEVLLPHTDLPENNHQPMEVVAQPETANTVESQPVEDPPSFRFTWRIDNFTRLNTKKLYSEIFVVGGYKWFQFTMTVMMPAPIDVRLRSPTLTAHTHSFSLALPLRLGVRCALRWIRIWVTWLVFVFVFVQQQEDEEVLVPHTDLPENNHQPMEVVAQPETANTVESQPVEDPPSSRFTWRIDNFSRLNTKKLYSEIFVVGGYKCWFVNITFQAVYHMPTTENDMPSGSIPLALQSLFYKLQYSDTSVATKELTKSFGWDTYDSFMQHDVQELNRVLCEKLEDKMKGTVVEGTIQKLFEGHHMNYIECINVDYKSTRKESFYDLQLDVKGCRDVYASFDKYVEVESLEGDNKYHAEQYDFGCIFETVMHDPEYYLGECKNQEALLLCSFHIPWLVDVIRDLVQFLFPPLPFYQKPSIHSNLFAYWGMQQCVTVKQESELLKLRLDAKKGVLFIDFPPVLQLQLKRFEYDFMRDTMVKINDRYEFPLQLDLDRDDGKYLSPDADRTVRNLYTLHSVLVHSGGVHGGHYYAFIRPTLSEQWYKFDDERVTKEDNKRALEEQYGGEEELPQANPGFNNTPFKFTKYSNAYMLVYIRESDKDKIICNVDEKDIAAHLRERLKKEQEEKEHKKKEKAEAHLYTIIKVAHDEDLKRQIGKDIYFDLVDHDKVRSFRVQKQTTFNLFKVCFAVMLFFLVLWS